VDDDVHDDVKCEKRREGKGTPEKGACGCINKRKE
ncbi:hypothetical protein A2U01_0084137, partial [Trifolium medium]|nr:hypothetical protein [Trifolium medium]